MKVFCSGIGGIGLSAYAAHMHSLGHDVSGTDTSDSETIRDLVSQGIKVALEQNAASVPIDTELFVYSEAVSSENPERKKATELGVRQVSYFQALGELTASKDVIAICGTHGKSSTTAMVAKVFIDAGLDPNVVIGTKTADLGGRNWRKGNSNIWIVEACEYRRSFTHLKVSTVLLTNADGDHFDVFTSQQDYTQAFVDFLTMLPKEGSVIAHGNDPRSREIIQKAGKTLIDADVENMPHLRVPGLHMQKNAQLVLALARQRKLDLAQAEAALLGYAGSWRRMEVKGETKLGVTVIDDYAHHPVEIRATIAAIKSAYPDRRLVCVFEPHTNDRVLKLWNDFTHAFTGAGLVLVTKVFGARPEKDTESADVAKFAAEIGRTCKVACRPTGSLSKTKNALEQLLQNDDVLLVMGAGDSTKLATQMVS